MIPSSSLVRLLAVALVSLLATACASELAPSSDDGLAEGEGETAASEDEIRASCTNPRKYFATFRSGTGTCAAVTAPGGRWVPEPLFREAPADVQTSTCAFRWSGRRGSPPDRARLVEAVGLDNGLAPACGGSSEVSLGNLEPIPSVDNLTQGGSVGCDVCGIVRDRVVWAVLPPDKIRLKQFAVRLSNGQERAFQIADAGEGRAVRVTLPPPPRGTKYEQGRVTIF